jgi:hypothetical protein
MVGAQKSDLQLPPVSALHWHDSDGFLKIQITDQRRELYSEFPLPAESEIQMMRVFAMLPIDY